MTTPSNTNASAPAAAERAPPQVLFDWRDWLPHIAEMRGTDAEKQALIEALWSIVIGFVDLGWEVGSDAPETCGQVTEVVDLKTALRSAMLSSSDLTPEQEDA